jgi:hypothetical protein
MKLVGFNLKNNDDPREIVVFKRERIDEPGKMDVRYAIWDRDNPKFGITSPDYSQTAGIAVRENRKLIVRFLDNIIKRGEAKICYKYIGATEEMPEGFLTEVVPIICETKKYDPAVINQLREMRKMVDYL